MAMVSAWREQCTEECKNLVKWAFRGVCPSSFLANRVSGVTTRFVAPTVRILRLDVVETNGHCGNQV